MVEIAGTALSSKIGRRVMALFVICALIPLAGLFILTINEVSSRLESDANTSTRRASKSVGMKVLERLHFLETDVRFATQELLSPHGAGQWSSTQFEKRFRSRFLGMVREIGGRVFAITGAAHLRPPTLTAKELEHLAKGNVVVASGARDAGLVEVVMIVRVDPGDPEKGIVFAWPDPQYLWIGDDLAGDLDEFLIFDDEDRLVFATAEAPNALLGLHEARRRRGSTGNFDWEGSSGAQYLAGYWQLFMSPQYHNNWMLVASRPRVDVMAPIAEFNQSFLLVSIFTFLLVVILNLTQINRLLKPIAALKDATRVVDGDDLHARVTVDSDDEFADLAQSFNEMLDRLQENIDQREGIQAALELARDSALAAARTESEILTNVSHELRTPIASILAFAEILNTHDVSEGDAAEFTTIILTESERISRLLENMLNLSKIHSGDAEIAEDEVSLDESVQQTCVSLGGAGMRRRIQIAVTNSDEGVIVAGDRDQLAQVWTNIIGNAIKFSDEGAKIEVSVHADDGFGVVEVRDSGAGIPMEDHALIFDRFRQSTNNLTDKPSGTGIGLTIARDIIALHSGEIEVESEPGEGSLFRVMLPQVASPAILQTTE